jgi:hypothetical protein
VNNNIRQRKAIESSYKKKLLAVNPILNENSGIYFLTRTDENGIKYFYIGQAKHILSRLADHFTGFQHIDLSLKKRGLYSVDNPYGWKVNALNYPVAELDKWEQYWILNYTKQGYQCRYNKTAGGQGAGKEKINEYRPAKGYRDGLTQGYKNASREVANLFEKHLNVSIKSDKPNKNQQKALEKFNNFLECYKE